MLTLLPDLPQEPLLAAVIAYRGLYYALPALIGGMVLLRGPMLRGARGRTAPALMTLARAPHLPFLLDAVIDRAPRAEAALLRHGRLGVLGDGAGRPIAMAAETGQALVLLCDPLQRGANPARVLALAQAAARTRFLTPVLYKAGPRLAAAARGAGWLVLPVAEEAWLDPRRFTPAGAARRQLRRKLRQAEAAGVTTSAPGPADALPLAEMDAIARAWAGAHGGERGFSMGGWHPDTLGWARVVLAHDRAGRLVGFVTLHSNAREHTLDLMRSAPDAPDGTMHRLVAEAIAGAARDGVARLSLAAVPRAPRAADPLPIRSLRARLDRDSGAAGLRQFKASFAPHWEPLYAAAPSATGLALGALDLAREIARPDPPVAQGRS